MQNCRVYISWKQKTHLPETLKRKKRKKNTPQPTVWCIIMLFGVLKKLLGVVTLPLGQV